MDIAFWQVLIAALIIAFVVWIYGTIATKAGYSRWWSLLMLVPIVNLITVWVFAFANWPKLTPKTPS